MRTLIFLLVSFPCQAVLSVSVEANKVTQTQAVAMISGASGACTLDLSGGGVTHHPDILASEYSGANIDTRRADTITWADGTRWVTLGHMTDDRALAADTSYTVTVSGCGATQAATFKTATLPPGSTTTWPVPFNAARWGNMAYPPIDWSLGKNQKIVDPITGVKLKPVNAGNDWSWRTGGGASGLSSAYYAFPEYAGGTGWSSPGSVLNGSISTATTSNTNPIDLYIDLQNHTLPGHADERIRPYDITTSARLLEDVGLVLWGSGTDATAANRQFQACIIRNPGDGCYSGAITITAPTGSVAAIHSATTTSDPDYAWPASFPKPAFGSWGDYFHYLRNEDMEMTGTLTIGASGALTIPSPGPQSHFSTTLKAGAPIHLDNTSPTCANNICMISSVTDSAHATIVEHPTPANGVAYRAYGWGIRIWKSNSTGSITVGAGYKVAGSKAAIPQSLGDHCSPKGVVSGDGIPGHVCEIIFNNAGDLPYFIGNDGTIRGLSFLSEPPAARMLTAGSPAPSQDYPNIYYNASSPIGFDQNNGKVMYISTPTKSTPTSWSIYKLTYGCDFTNDFSQASNYTGDSSNMWLSGYGGPDDCMTWENIMPPSLGKDLLAQIAGHTEYNGAIYGNTYAGTSSPWAFQGCSGDYCQYSNSYGGQGDNGSGGPGWIATIQISTGTLSRLYHTLDAWGSLHSPAPQDEPANTFNVALNTLRSNNSGTTHGGPFEMQLTGVMRSGSFDTNTSLVWPPVTCPGTGCYDTGCPTGNAYEYLGATTNQCVTLEMTQPCNIAPTTAEKARWPCPWNANYSMPKALAVGNLFYEYGTVDQERLRVISITPTTGNKYRVVAQRDAAMNYCCQSSGHDPSSDKHSFCVDSSSQAAHANDWIPAMAPGVVVGACEADSFIINESTGVRKELGREFPSHFNMGIGTGGTVNFGTMDAAKFQVPFDNIADLPTTFSALGTPSFGGLGFNIGSGGGPQSYTNIGQYDQLDSRWELDANAMFVSSEGIAAFASRKLTNMSGNIWKITPVDNGGDALTPALYKKHPLSGSSGQYQWREVSGPKCTADLSATPYSFGYVLHDGECFPGSIAGETYFNAPQVYDPAGGCGAGQSWANVPCVSFGYDAPLGGIRQQRIAANDNAGSHSRFLSYAYSAPLRQWTFYHGIVHPSGVWAISEAASYVDGRQAINWAISIPPWTEKNNPVNTPANDLIDYPVTVAPGPALAKIRYGYSRNIGPNAAPSTFACTNRTGDACTTATATGQPFTFESEAGTGTSCASGCTINIKTHQPNLMYYQTFRSSDGGTTWAADSADPNIHPVALGAPISANVQGASGTSITGSTVSGARIQ